MVELLMLEKLQTAGKNTNQFIKFREIARKKKPAKETAVTNGTYLLTKKRCHVKKYD
jgi:hypothetical protein